MQTFSAVSYYRVSTQQQGKSGLGLEAQRKAVLDHVKAAQWHLVAEFTEIETGRRKDRPELLAALELCRQRKATLVIAKLDRLARSVAFISALLESRVRFIALDMLDADPSFLQMASVFGEWEARRSSDRTKAALAAAKARGTKLGWAMPSRRGEQRQASLLGADANRSKAQHFALNTLPLISGIRNAGAVTLAEIAEAMNQRGIKTARGARWRASTVHKLINHSKASL